MTTTSVSGGDICRLTVCGPHSQVELAVPVHVPLADLLPTLLVHLDQRLATSGLEHGGWVLQRLGEAPLDEDLGTAALGLYDGDVVHLRPRDEQLPPIDFDDVVDGVATAIADRADRWRPEHGRRMGLAGAAVAAVTGLSLLVVASPSEVIARLALATAVVFLAAAAAASHGFDDEGVARLLGVIGTVSAAVAGLALPLAWSTPGPRGRPDGVLHLAAAVGAPSVLTASGFTIAAAVMARFLTTAAARLWDTLTVGALLAAVGAGLQLMFGLTAPQAAALLMPVILLVGYFTPTLAASFMGIRVPPLPTTPSEFQDDLQPEPSGALLDRANAADRYVTGLYTAFSALAVVVQLLIGRDGGWAPPWLVLAVSCVLLLHCRELISARQRCAMLAPAVAGVLTLLIGDFVDAGSLARSVGGLGFLAVALLACAGARVLPGRRLIPHWGLAGDILHWVVAISILPLALQVAGFFHFISHLWS